MTTPHAEPATASQTIGPFFHFALGTDPALGHLAPEGTRGDRLRLQVRVFDGVGAPVSDALIEIWQADADGVYVESSPREDLAVPRFSGFGRLATGEDGACTFDTIRPGRAPDGHGGQQASHINICVFARGLLRQIYTRAYFAGDAALAEDRVLALVPHDRRRTLLAELVTGQSNLWRLDIRLQGEGETVFFDL